jgi:hypothetical protein
MKNDEGRRVYDAEKMQSVGVSGWPRLTGIAGAAYPNTYDLLTRHRGYVLLLPDAGVWVGTRRNSSHPTRRKRVGFVFIRFYELGVGAGWTFGIFRH